MSTEKGLHPQDAIGYWLASAFRAVSGAYAEALRAHCLERGKTYVITPAQSGVLSLVDHFGDQSIGAIAQELRVDLATITGIVTRLEQIGLLEREHSRVDRRVVTVTLTAEGRDIVTSAYAVAEASNKRVLHGLSAAERAALLNQLRRIIANVSPEASDSPSEA